MKNGSEPYSELRTRSHKEIAKWLHAKKCKHVFHNRPSCVEELLEELEDYETLRRGELIAAAEQLLAWQPLCSKGSSGDLRQNRLRAAIDNLGRDGSLNEAVSVKADLEHPGNDTGGETAESRLERAARQIAEATPIHLGTGPNTVKHWKSDVMAILRSEMGK